MINKFVPGKLYEIICPVYFSDKIHPSGTIVMLISASQFKHYDVSCYDTIVLIENKIIGRKNTFLDWFEEL